MTLYKGILLVLAFIASIFLRIASAQTGGDLSQHYYKEPDRYPHRDYINQNFMEQIDPFSGTLNLSYVDLFLPGNGGLDLKVQRRYSSLQDPAYTGGMWVMSSPLVGLGWSIHFGRLTNVGGGCPNFHQPVLELPDGSRQVFYRPTGGNPPLLSAERWKGECQPGAPGGGFILTSPEGVRYEMTQRKDEVIMTYAAGPVTGVWYPRRIEDRYGNSMTFTYAGPAGNLSSITTSDGRQMNFSYVQRAGFWYVSSISGAGRTWTYNYRNADRLQVVDYLNSVMRPDGNQWHYDYLPFQGTTQAGSYSLRSLTYPQGGQIYYTYGYVQFTSELPGDRTTVVSTKGTTDGTWFFSYSPGSLGVLAQTTVTTPVGQIVYRHFGYNTVASGTVWKVGLLAEKHTGSEQSEYYDWGSQFISSEWLQRPVGFQAKFDSGTYVPIMTRKRIARDGANYTTDYSNHDIYGNPQNVSESGTHSRTTLIDYYYNTAKWIVKQVRNENISTIGAITRTFNSDGFMTSENRFGVATGYTPTPQGDVGSKTNARSRTTFYSNYHRGIPRTENWPETVNLSRAVSDAGNVEAETNGEGHTTNYSYDGLNRIIGIAYPIRNPVNVSYTSITKTITRGSYTETTTYDGYGRPRSINRNGITQNMNYDALGRKTFESFPGSLQGTTYDYDILGRIRSVQHPGGSRTMAYSGNNITVTNERSKTTTYQHRAYGNPDDRVVTAIITPEPGTNVSIGRNGLGQITTLSQGSFTRTYGYNTRFFLTSVDDPETGTTVYGRDGVGNMTSRRVGSSSTTNYEIDGLNRTTEILYPSGSTPNVTLGYDKNSKLIRATNSAANRTFDYDENSFLRSESLIIDGYTFNTAYGFNGNDVLNTLTYPRTGRVVTYNPNALGRPTQVLPYATSVSHHDSGNISQVQLANGKTISLGENTQQWSDSIRVSPFIDKLYQYDGVGNVLRISDAVEAGETLNLDYDGIDRLTVANGPWGIGSINYDAVGNITAQRFGSFNLTYHYPLGNRLASTSGGVTRTFSYDVYGNVSANGSFVFEYDDASNLRRVNPGASEFRYAYDGKNMRVRTEKSGVRTYYVYSANGDLLLEFVPAQGNATKEHTYLRGKRIATREADSRTATSSTVSAAPNPALAEQTVTLTATITGSSPTGTVTFRDGAAVLSTQTLVAGRASYSTSTLSVGSHSITVRYNGDSNNSPSTSPSLNVVVNPDLRTPTTTTLTLAPNPSIHLQTVTMTATVVGSSPTGIVIFKEDTLTLGTAPLVAGRAVITHAMLSIGTHPIRAEYQGDTNNRPSTSAVVTQRVDPPPCPVTTSTVLTVTPSSIIVDNEAILTARVTGYNPTGSVNFFDGAEQIGSGILTGGQVSSSIRFITAGIHPLTARYSGDACNNPSTSSIVNLDVARAATETLLFSAPDTTMQGLPVTFYVYIVGYNPGGTVIFRDGATIIGTAEVFDSVAYVTTTRLTLGEHSITAEYSGDSNNNPSTSAPLGYIVTPNIPALINLINSILLSDE